MKLRDFLINTSNEELTELLKYLDRVLYELHSNGYYVVGDLLDIEVIDNQITLASFNNKLDYINSGIDQNCVNRNIFELCIIGMSAYCKLSALRTISLHQNEEDTKKFIYFITNNEEALFLQGNVPSIMQGYYIDVFDRGNVKYLNDYIANNEIEKNGESRSNSRGAYTKSTAVGKALAEKENAAFATILVIPALLALVYILAVVVYFVFVK